MAGTLRHMWNKGGLKPFFTAYRVTAVREGLMRQQYRSIQFFPLLFPANPPIFSVLPDTCIADSFAAAFGSIYESSRYFFRFLFSCSQHLISLRLTVLFAQAAIALARCVDMQKCNRHDAI